MKLRSFGEGTSPTQRNGYGKVRSAKGQCWSLCHITTSLQLLLTATLTILCFAGALTAEQRASLSRRALHTYWHWGEHSPSRKSPFNPLRLCFTETSASLDWMSKTLSFPAMTGGNVLTGRPGRLSLMRLCKWKYTRALKLRLAARKCNSYDVNSGPVRGFPSSLTPSEAKIPSADRSLFEESSLWAPLHSETRGLLKRPEKKAGNKEQTEAGKDAILWDPVCIQWDLWDRKAACGFLLKGGGRFIHLTQQICPEAGKKEVKGQQTNTCYEQNSTAKHGAERGHTI